MPKVDVFGTEFQYVGREIAGQQYLSDTKGRLEITLSTRKADIAPFKGEAAEIFFLPAGVKKLQLDLGKRAAVYAYVKIVNISPSLKCKATIKKMVKQLVTAYLTEQGKLKEQPKFIAHMQTLDEVDQLTVAPFEKVFEA